MIERPQGAVDFVCDRRDSPHCHDRLATCTVPFVDALEVARKCLWRVFKCDGVGTGYIHACPQCTAPR
jgi:hypothetical protein